MLAEAHVPVIRQKNGAWNMTEDSRIFAARILEFLPSSLSCRKATERIKINNRKSKKNKHFIYKPKKEELKICTRYLSLVTRKDLYVFVRVYAYMKVSFYIMQ